MDLLEWYEKLTDEQKENLNPNILLRVGFLRLQLEQMENEKDTSTEGIELQEDKKENETPQDLFKRGYQDIQEQEEITSE